MTDPIAARITMRLRQQGVRVTPKISREIVERVRLLREKQIPGSPAARAVSGALLRVNGDFALVPPELDRYERFVSAAPRVFSGKQAKFRRMQPSRCHTNAAELHQRDPKRYQIASGWALSQDADGFRVWRSHSWAVDTIANRIIETTSPRDIYWGRMLSPKLARRFTFSECGL
jgi:hypothetical protein